MCIVFPIERRKELCDTNEKREMTSEESHKRTKKKILYFFCLGSRVLFYFLFFVFLFFCVLFVREKKGRRGVVEREVGV